MLEGKRALVTGVANRWSIATGIARKLHEHGASIALTYQGERVRDEVEKLAAELGKGLAPGSAGGDSLEGRWAWAAAALSTNRATWAFALDASLYSVWQAAMLRDASPLERFVPFFGMSAFLMRGGGAKKEREEREA